MLEALWSILGSICEALMFWPQNKKDSKFQWRESEEEKKTAHLRDE